MTSPRHEKLRTDLAELKLHRIAEVYQEVLDDPRQRAIERVRELAPTNGFGAKPAGA